MNNGTNIQIILKSTGSADASVYGFQTQTPIAGQGTQLVNSSRFNAGDVKVYNITLSADFKSIGVFAAALDESVDIPCIIKYDNLGVENGLPLTKPQIPIFSLKFTNPIPYAIDFYSKLTRINYQGIAVYNGNVFDMGTGTVSVNGGTSFEITNGHGNNANFGTTIHGDYPYLYCASWNQDDCKIYVNEVTNNSATLVRTIDFNLNGYLNAVVDEPNNLIYILLNVSNTTPEGVIDFIVANLSDGSIVSTKRLPYTIPVIQGMCLGNNCIYVAHGGVSPYTENHITI